MRRITPRTDAYSPHNVQIPGSVGDCGAAAAGAGTGALLSNMKKIIAKKKNRIHPKNEGKPNGFFRLAAARAGAASSFLPAEYSLRVQAY
ncbi:hypothetical protein BH10PLA1_BH10PLA1_22190 [soil metagenome]